jgi:hypothetical protein
MGISNALAGGIIMMALVYVLLSVPGLVDRHFAVSNALLQRSQADDLALKTSITISSLSLAAADTVSVSLSNTGNTKLWEYSKFTVIATYDADVSGSRVKTTEQLSYGGITATPGAGQWVLHSFDPSIDSYVDPKVVNPGEQFVIRFKPQNAIYSSSPSVLVAMSTENGALTSRGGVL